MEPSREVAARLDADRHEAAERMTFGERLLAGAAMFDTCVVMMRTGIRLQRPDADEQAIDDLVRARLRNARRFEAKG